MDKILIVDDNLAVLRQIRAHLAGDYDVLLAKSGEMAVKLCLSEQPDLILLDIEMPEMDGFETIAKLRGNPHLGRIPVIFLTADTSDETEVKGLASGARDFITKPVEKNILLHRIALHLRFSFYQKSLERKVSVLSDNLAVSFAELIECRDEGTGGHVMRTAMYVEKLGREVIRHGLFPGELSEDELAMIVRAAPLHDIGKIGIKDSILLKPGKLDNDEFAVMKRHAALGEEILEGMYKRAPVQSYLQYASIIAASHHEKYDGTGYPRHMEGRGIPLCGRIMAVADVYDSLVDTRVYRKAMSHEEACAIILDGKGGHFDPDLVEIFDSCHRDFLDMFSRSQEA